MVRIVDNRWKLMLYKLDYNQDGKVNWIDAAAYLINLIGPYILIIIGITTPIEREIKTTVITLGAGLAGTAQKEEKRKDFQEDLPQDPDLPDHQGLRRHLPRRRR